MLPLHSLELPLARLDPLRELRRAPPSLLRTLPLPPQPLHLPLELLPPLAAFALELCRPFLRRKELGIELGRARLGRGEVCGRARLRRGVLVLLARERRRVLFLCAGERRSVLPLERVELASVCVPRGKLFGVCVPRRSKLSREGLARRREFIGVRVAHGSEFGAEGVRVLLEGVEGGLVRGAEARARMGRGKRARGARVSLRV